MLFRKAFFACLLGSIAASAAGCLVGPGSSDTQKDIAPDNGVVSARVQPALRNTVQGVTFDKLAPGRYAFFYSTTTFTSHASLVAFDVDKSCSSVTAPSDCPATSLVTAPGDASVHVFTLESGVTKSDFISIAMSGTTDKPINIALRALDNGTISAPVSVDAANVTDASDSPTTGPSIVALPLE
jgi:hypothetical protein